MLDIISIYEVTSFLKKDEHITIIILHKNIY